MQIKSSVIHLLIKEVGIKREERRFCTQLHANVAAVLFWGFVCVCVCLILNDHKLTIRKNIRDKKKHAPRNLAQMTKELTAIPACAVSGQCTAAQRQTGDQNQRRKMHLKHALHLLIAQPHDNPSPFSHRSTRFLRGSPPIFFMLGSLFFLQEFITSPEKQTIDRRENTLQQL